MEDDDSLGSGRYRRNAESRLSSFVGGTASRSGASRSVCSREKRRCGQLPDQTGSRYESSKQGVIADGSGEGSRRSSPPVPWFGEAVLSRRIKELARFSGEGSRRKRSPTPTPNPLPIPPPPPGADPGSRMPLSQEPRNLEREAMGRRGNQDLGTHPHRGVRHPETDEPPIPARARRKLASCSNRAARLSPRATCTSTRGTSARCRATGTTPSWPSAPPRALRSR